MSALGVTDRQLALIRRAAGLLPERSRADFLRLVAGRLSGAVATNGEITAAVNFALSLRGVSAGRGFLLSKKELTK